MLNGHMHAVNETEEGDMQDKKKGGERKKFMDMLK